jgi:hypothetical protein
VGIAVVTVICVGVCLVEIVRFHISPDSLGIGCCVGLLGLRITKEWTVAGNQLLGRHWLSRPGARPSVVLQLGPDIEVTHESRHRWHFNPGGPTLSVRASRTPAFIAALKPSGVRIDDWWGDWAGEHRLLNKFGPLVGQAGGVGLVIAVAIAIAFPPLASLAPAVALGSIGLMAVSAAIALMPWDEKGFPKSA